eukprot:15055712-Alexandrium_andersonii.AAC.1
MKRDLIGADATLTGRVKPDLLDAMMQDSRSFRCSGRSASGATKRAHVGVELAEGELQIGQWHQWKNT